MEIVNRVEPSLEWKLAQPTVWATLNCGVRIQELLPDKYDEVAELIRTQLIPRETMCKALNMHDADPDSCETFVQEAICCMRDGYSIVGIVEEEVPDVTVSQDVTEESDVTGENGDSENDRRERQEKKRDEEEGEKKNLGLGTYDKVVHDNEENHEEEPVRTKERVVAAMIAKVIQKREAMETFSRVKIYKGESYNKYVKLNNHMMSKADLYTAHNTDSYYRIYHIVVHDDYKNRGIALFMGKLATLRLTALFKQTICVKLCPDRPTQHLMRRLGFTDYLRLGYEEWVEKGNQVFFHTGVGNYSIVLMIYEAGKLGDVNEPLEEPEIEEEPGRYSVFPGRAKTGQPSVGNRGHLLKPTPPMVTGRLADYRYLFEITLDDETTFRKNSSNRYNSSK